MRKYFINIYTLIAILSVAAIALLYYFLVFGGEKNELIESAGTIVNIDKGASGDFIGPSSYVGDSLLAAIADTTSTEKQVSPTDISVAEEETEEVSAIEECTDDYIPVCGSNDTTFWNECFAERAQIDISYTGACEEKEKINSETQENITSIETREENLETINETVPIEKTENEISIDQDTVTAEEDNTPKPDLLINLFDHYGSVLNQGDTMSFFAIIENIGEVSTDKIFNTQIFIDRGNDGTNNLTYKKIEIEVLEPGEKQTLSWQRAWTQESGTHRAEACTDIDDTIRETDESNNCSSIVIVIKGSQTNGDLIVENVNVMPPNPKAGDPMHFFATIKNIGSEKVNQSDAYLFVDNHIIGKTGFTNTNPSIPSLKPGEIKTIEWKNQWQFISKSLVFKVCADGANKVFEANEDNNCTAGSFPVSSE